MNYILIVDDVPSICEQYAYDLRRLGEYEVYTATSGEQGLALLEQEPIDCMILDLEMPGMDGFGLLKQLRKQKISLPVIVYTGTGNYERCVRAIRDGAYSFIDKAEPMERVVREIENALEKERLSSELSALRERTGENGPIIGESPAMVALKNDIARLAPIPRPVLILGESGTGKELVARELHRLGGRSDNTYLPINCAALSENLIEGELFGHEAGAFTGAKRMQKGAFEAASDGTLFLDEIGELPLAMQGVFLRVLEENKITRLRGTRQIPISTRVVAATGRRLEEEIDTGRFRKDLFFRLSVHLIRVPPLRERLADVPLLAEHFLSHVAVDYKRRGMRFSGGAAALLQTYDWQANNVRELRNVIERLVSYCRSDTIDEATVRAELDISRSWGQTGAVRGTETSNGPGSGDTGGTLKERKADAEREIIKAALARNNNQIGKTALELGLADHSSLLKIMKRLAIK
jgi:DNA-binding NtrC family response regulator